MQERDKNCARKRVGKSTDGGRGGSLEENKNNHLNSA